MIRDQIKELLRQLMQAVPPLIELLCPFNETPLGRKEFHGLHRQYMILSDRLIVLTRNTTSIIGEQSEVIRHHTERLRWITRRLRRNPHDEALWTRLQEERERNEAAMRVFDAWLKPLLVEMKTLQDELKGIEIQQRALNG